MTVVVLNFILAIQGDTYSKKKDKALEIYATDIIELRSVHGVQTNGSNWYVSNIVPLNLFFLLLYVVVLILCCGNKRAARLTMIMLVYCACFITMVLLLLSPFIFILGFFGTIVILIGILAYLVKVAKE